MAVADPGTCDDAVRFEGRPGLGGGGKQFCAVLIPCEIQMQVVGWRDPLGRAACETGTLVVRGDAHTT